MFEKFLNSNNATTFIVAMLVPSGTEVVLTPGAGAMFPTPVPDQYFVGTLSNANGTLNEIVKVVDRTGDVLTVVRAQEGTDALPWEAGSLFAQKWTEGQAQALVQTTMLRPVLDIEFPDGDAEVELDLSDYNFTSAGILVRMVATEEKTLVDITGLTVLVTIMLLVDESSEAIEIPYSTPPFYLSNIYGDVGFPGYARTTISLLSVPEASVYRFIETSRTARTS